MDSKEIQPVHSKGDQSWVFFGRNDAKAETPVTLATSCEELTHWKRLWCWEGLGAGEKGDDRGWDDWIASLTRWTWVWVNSRSWWWTGRPGVLQLMGWQRVRHNWATELNWTEKSTYTWYYISIWKMLCISLGFPDSSVGKESTCNAWVRKIHWRRDRLLTPVFLGFHRGSAGKESACNTGDLGSVPGLGRHPGQGKGYPLQYSGLENTMACIVHGVTESDVTFTFTFALVLLVHRFLSYKSPSFYHN